MDKFINPSLRFADRFLAHFKPCFTNKQWPMFRQYIYAMFADYKRPSIEAFADKLNINYQKLQYFFSEADLGYQKTQRYPFENPWPSTDNTRYGTGRSCDR